MAIVLVNSTSANSAGSATSLATFALAITAGNLIVIVTSIGAATDAVSTITDETGNVYKKAVSVTGTLTNTLELWYGIAVDGGSLTFNVTWGGAGVNRRVLVLQYKNVADVLDGTNSNSVLAGATSLTTNSVSTTNANDLLVAAFALTVAQALTVTNSFTGEVSTPATPDTSAQDRIVSATGSFAGTATATATGYAGVIAAFKSVDVAITKANKWVLTVN